MKRIIVLVLGFLVMGPVVSFAGGLVGNAGSVVRDRNGNLVPADFYFHSRQYKLPEYYQPFELDSETKADVENVVDFIRKRSLGKIDLGELLKETEFYTTTKFLGDDMFVVHQGGEYSELSQIAFSYAFSVPKKDNDGIVLSFSKKRRIVEIDPNQFYRLGKVEDGRWHRALAIVHELLHLSGLGGISAHEYISPFIDFLNGVLLARDGQALRLEQNPEMLPDITEEEMQKSRFFQKALRAIQLEIGDLTLLPEYQIARGGGLIAGRSLEQVDGNFVDLSSVVDIFFVEDPYYFQYDGDLIGKRSFSGNTVLQSELEIFVSQAFCSENRFERVSMKFDCFGKKNNLRNVESSFGPGSLLKGEENQVERLNSIMLRIYGSKNRVMDVQSRSLWINGNGNSATRVDASQTGLVLTRMNLSDIEIESNEGVEVRFQSGALNPRFKLGKMGRNAVSNLKLKLNSPVQYGIGTEFTIYTGYPGKEIGFDSDERYLFELSSKDGSTTLSDPEDWEKYRVKE